MIKELMVSSKQDPFEWAPVGVDITPDPPPGKLTLHSKCAICGAGIEPSYLAICEPCWDEEDEDGAEYFTLYCPKFRCELPEHFDSVNEVRRRYAMEHAACGGSGLHAVVRVKTMDGQPVSKDIVEVLRLRNTQFE